MGKKLRVKSQESRVMENRVYSLVPCPLPLAPDVPPLNPDFPPESILALASGMADDFNNILTTVMAACSLIDKNDPINAELLQYVALIRDSAERAADLSGKLVLASTLKMENGYSASQPHDSVPDGTSIDDKKGDDDVVSHDKISVEAHPS